MSENEAPQPTSKELKANLKAEKARLRALRPWFKKKRFVIPIAILGLSFLGSIFGGGENSPAPSDAEPSATETQDVNSDSTLGIGDEASDGKFTFVVNSFECGIKNVGDEFLNVEAKGEFCKVNVSVTNTGDESQYMFADNQLLFDSQGRQFASDSTANLYAGDGTDVWISELNPGLSLNGDLYFDVPNGNDIVEIELHDSAFSGGVKVGLK